MQTCGTLHFLQADHLLGSGNLLSAGRWLKGCAHELHRGWRCDPKVINRLNVGAEPEANPEFTVFARSRREVSNDKKKLWNLLQGEIPVLPQAITVGGPDKFNELCRHKSRHPLGNLLVDPAPILHGLLTDKPSSLGIGIDRRQVPIGQGRRRFAWAIARSWQVRKMAVRFFGSTRYVVQLLFAQPAADSGPMVVRVAQSLVTPAGQVLLRRYLPVVVRIDGDFHGGSSL